jgi:hypothetical protein
LWMNETHASGDFFCCSIFNCEHLRTGFRCTCLIYCIKYATRNRNGVKSTNHSFEIRKVIHKLPQIFVTKTSFLETTEMSGTYCFCNVVCIHYLFTLILLHRRKSCLTYHQHSFLVLCNRLSPYIYLTTLRASITRMACKEERKTNTGYTQSALRHTHNLIPFNNATRPTSAV